MRLFLMALTFLATGYAVAAEPYRRLVNFEWEVIEGAKSYEIQIQALNKENAKVHSFKVKEAAWNGRLPAGKYGMKLRALDYRGVPGDWGEQSEFDVNLENVVMKYPAPSLEIKSGEEKEERVTFEWAPVGGADVYIFEVTSEDGKFTKTEELEHTTTKVMLPVATRFTWKVSAKTKTGIPSDGVSVAQFDVIGAKLDKPKIEKPESDFVREIKWSQPELTEKYDLAINRYNKQTKKWETVKSLKDHPDTVVSFDERWPGGQYKIVVRSKANLRQSSETASESFNVRDGERTPAAEYTALVRKSIDRVTGWYGIASYLITQITYSNIYQDTKTGLTYSAIGGTGRLGLGWFSETSKWGFLSILDLSGFTNDGQTLTYASLEVSSVYRKILGERGELRSQLGLYYKELPGTTGNSAAGTSTNEQMATAGPHLGIEYWHSLTPKLGLQANAHLYMSLMKIKTPNGQDVEPTLSTQFGFLGSWRFNSRFTGLMGYARREDKIRYKAGQAVAGSFADGLDLSGLVNETTVTGDYLNFFAEYAF